MKLTFPNPSRSFDPSKNRVQFWGYRQSLEISFYVDGAILLKLQPDSTNDQAGLLAAFDACVGKLQKVADAEYGRGGAGSASYSLPASAF